MQVEVRRYHKKVLAWGNSYGIRLTKRELEEAGIGPGQEVSITIQRRIPKVDWSKIATLDMGPNASQEIDEVLYEGFLEDDEGDRP